MKEERLKKLLPFDSHFITIAGHKMHYIDEGKGPVVIMLHGNPTWCFMYRKLIATLKDQYRVIALDMLGAGLSDHPKNTHFTASDRIEHLKEFIDKLGLTRFSLVMHDWGGSIASAYAVDNVEKIEKLVYLNTTLTDVDSLPKFIKRAARPHIGKYLTKTTKWFLRVMTTKGMGVVKKLPKDVKKGFFHPYNSISRRTAIWDFVSDIPFSTNYDSYARMLHLRESIKRLSNLPVQIVWGMKDPCFHQGMLKQLKEHFPQASVLELQDASHLVLEDAPEEACEAIKRFLAGPPYQKSFDKPHYDNGENAIYKNFKNMVAGRPAATAIIIPTFKRHVAKYNKVSFASLNEIVNRYQRGLEGAGLKSGDKVVMLVSPSVDFLALSYAVMGRGGIPIFLDPGMGIEKLIYCIKSAKPEGFIFSPKANLLRMKCPTIFKGAKFHITVGKWYPGAGISTESMMKCDSDELPVALSNGTSLIAYTSGATGTPKGVIYTDVMMNEQIRIFRDVFGFSSENFEKDLPLLPVFSLFTVALGICSVFPPVDPAKPLELDPEEIVYLINDLNISYSFGSPALWKKISRYCVDNGKSLGSLKKIFMAGAPVQRETLECLKTLLDNGEATTPYGATEALPVTLISMDEILEATPQMAVTGEQGVLVGKQISSMRVGIIKAVDEVLDDIKDVTWLPNYQIGEVIVSGLNVSPAYFEKPEATNLAKIKDGNAFWHRMGDMGYLDNEGNLYFCGRKAHAVTTKDKVYYSVPTEAIFNTHESVARSALVGINNGEDVAIVIEPLANKWKEVTHNKEKIISELKELANSNPITAGIDKFYFYKSFPVDGRHNAKIFRDQLAEWVNKQIKKN